MSERKRLIVTRKADGVVVVDVTADFADTRESVRHYLIKAGEDVFNDWNNQEDYILSTHKIGIRKETDLYIYEFRAPQSEDKPPKPVKGVRMVVTKTVWLDSDNCEHDTEQEAIESDLDGNHGLSMHVYKKPDGSDDAQAVELFKRLLELRGEK